MKRALLILAVAALALPAAAFGKGPSDAVINGPGAGDGGGGGGGITFKGCCAPGTPTMDLAEGAGFFPATWEQQPNPMLDGRPEGDLGPKYTITYTVPGPEGETWTIKQDLYPYAPSGPVTYMRPGQAIFQVPGGTRGGWFQATPQLKETLVAAGLPASAASAASVASAAGRDWSVPTLTLSAIMVLVFLCVAVFVLRRRRTRPAARMAGSPT